MRPRLLASAALAALLALSACSRDSGKDPAAASLTVTVATAEQRDLPRTLLATGSVVAWQELVLGSEAAGLKVAELLVDEGDHVEQGQLLARLDDAVLVAQLRQQEAAVVEAQAVVTKTRADAERAGKLSTEGNISAQTLDSRQADRRQAEARLANAEAKRDELKARIAQARVTAPSAGYITVRKVAIGSVVASGQELFRMVRDSRLELDAQLAEVDLARLQPGLKARVQHDSGLEAVGEIRAVAPAIDPKSRLGIVHIALPADAGFKPGMFARAQIETSRAPAVVVPEAAVVSREGRPQVFTLADDAKVEQRQVETGMRRDGFVEVLSGLKPGERIVLAGAGYLRDGDLVRVSNQTAQMPDSGAAGAGK